MARDNRSRFDGQTIETSLRERPQSGYIISSRFYQADLIPKVSEQFLNFGILDIQVCRLHMYFKTFLKILARSTSETFLRGSRKGPGIKAIG